MSEVLRKEDELKRCLKDISEVTNNSYEELQKNMDVRTGNLIKAYGYKSDYDCLRMINKAYLGVLNFVKNQSYFGNIDSDEYWKWFK
jgi:hypothetical protein